MGNQQQKIDSAWTGLIIQRASLKTVIENDSPILYEEGEWMVVDWHGECMIIHTRDKVSHTVYGNVYGFEYREIREKAYKEYWKERAYQCSECKEEAPRKVINLHRLCSFQIKQ